MRKAVAVHQTAQVIFGIERIRPGAGDTPSERAANGEVIEALEFPNLVLDVGLDALFDNSLVDMMGTCHVGTGTAEPATTDEGLANELTKTTNTSSTDTGRNDSPLYAYHTRVFVFGEGQAQGNLTEVGLSNGDATPIFFNRQLFRDGSNNAVTVTIASDEILRITAEGRWYSDIQTDESTTGQFTFKSTTIDSTRTVNSTAVWSGSAGPAENAFDAYDAGRPDNLDGVEPDSRSIGSYTSGDYSATYTLVWNAGTLDGSYTTLVYAIEAFKFDFSPTLDVDSTEELTLTLTRTWGRNP